MQPYSTLLRKILTQASVLSLLTLTLTAAVGTRAPAQAAITSEPAPAPANTLQGEPDHVRRSSQSMRERPPLPSSTDELRRSYDEPPSTATSTRPSTSASATAAAACSAADFTSRTGQALVNQIRASTTTCINTLFSLTGSDAYYAFREAQMVAVAYGFRDNALYYDGTNNGGMYLEGNPADPNNQARFIAYEAEWMRPTFEIWNLNHEYTHYLDGRFNMYGDFGANISTPTIWWIEGFAEYVSYSYRNLTYTAAINEAGRQTYALSTLFDTTYSHGTTRVYRWGYLAVRYMIQSHRSDVGTVLNYYRSGSWNTARSFLRGSIGSRYDTDWYTWLSRCAAGDCGGGTTNQPPIASFTYTVNGLTVSFTDRSSDPDGTITSRSWDFGDGTGSTSTNPSKTYSTAGTYTVALTVTDNNGATGTTSQTITVSSGGGTPECTGGDTRALGRNCSRSNRSAAEGDYDYLYIYIPAGVTSLQITTTGGTGDCDLYYNPYAWATTTDYTHVSANSANSESLTIASPPEGYNYISLYGYTGCSGVTVTTRY